MPKDLLSDQRNLPTDIRVKKRLDDCSNVVQLRAYYLDYKFSLFARPHFRCILFKRLGKLRALANTVEEMLAYDNLSEDIMNDDAKVVTQQHEENKKLHTWIPKIKKIKIDDNPNIQLNINKNLLECSDLATEVERELFRIVMQEIRSVEKMANVLGLCQRTVRNKLQIYGYTI